jgi:phage regulator Rha-like protein
MSELIPKDIILSKIYLIRNVKVMLDRDLAELYGVETSQLKRQVKRNIDRFPRDFMFELTKDEYQEFLRCHFGTLKRGEHSKYPPLAFTEQGVAMLSSVLNSKRAIQVNIQIMRAFIEISKFLSTHEDLRRKIEEIEKRYDEQFSIVFEVIKQLLRDDSKEVKTIGFNCNMNHANNTE